MHLLLTLIPLTAITTCLLIYITVIAGLIAIADLRRLYRSYTGHSATIGLPPVQGYRRTQLLGQAAAAVRCQSYLWWAGRLCCSNGSGDYTMGDELFL